MGKTAYGNIAGVPWSTSAESSYDIIVSSLQIRNNSEPKTLENEEGTVVLHVQDGEYTEIQCEAAIKGTNHFGQSALRGAVISALDDSDIPTPLFVVENSISKTKREWQTCSLTARYYAADFTTGTLATNTATTTTTTTTT